MLRDKCPIFLTNIAIEKGPFMDDLPIKTIGVP